MGKRGRRMRTSKMVAAIIGLSGAAFAVLVMLWAARSRSPQRRVRRLIEEAERRIREIERLLGS